MSAQHTENERMRMMIQTGRYIAPIDGRRATMQNGQILTPEQIRRIEQQLQGGMQKVVTLVGNEVHQTGRAIDAVYNRQAQELGMSLSEFRKGTSSMAEFDKRMAGYDQYQQWRAAHTTIDQQSGREIVARGNPYEQFAKWGTFRVDGDRYNDLVKLIQQRDQQAGQAYSMQSQAYRTMNRAEGVTLRHIMGGGDGGGRSGGRSGNGFDIASIAFNPISDESMKFDPSQHAQASGLRPEDILGPSDEWENYKDTITGAIGSIGDAMNNLSVENFQESYEKVNNDVSNLTDTAKQNKMAMSLAGQAVNAFSAALSGMEDPGVKAAGMVTQALGSIALGFAMASSQANTAGTGWGWLAWVAAGLGAMATAISTVHSLTGYAKGGIVEGNSYSGDNMMFGGDGLYGLNAGELVLTKSQQNSLAQQLSGNGMGNINVSGRISGTDILLSADRAAQASGRGQLVTWK